VLGGGADSGAIWTLRADGKNAKRLTNGDTLGEVDLAPDWSPNGELIAFQRYVECSGGTCRNAIFTVPATGGRPRLLARNAAHPSMVAGRQTDRLARRADVWVMYADGSGAHPITTSSASDVAPDWQPRRSG
jgi:Tol biopolymer transport system component